MLLYIDSQSSRAIFKIFHYWRQSSFISYLIQSFLFLLIINASHNVVLTLIVYFSQPSKKFCVIFAFASNKFFFDFSCTQKTLFLNIELERSTHLQASNGRNQSPALISECKETWQSFDFRKSAEKSNLKFHTEIIDMKSRHE